MHLEAIEVEMVDDVQCAVDELCDGDLDRLRMAASTNDKFGEIEIDGRNYVLFAFPHS